MMIAVSKVVLKERMKEYFKKVEESGEELIVYQNEIPVDETIWMENLSLDWEHKDPADRTIVATAHLRKLPIITTDRRIKDLYPNTIW
jgi:PIN domain nuclease of toxin-antitoxin system